MQVPGQHLTAAQEQGWAGPRRTRYRAFCCPVPGRALTSVLLWCPSTWLDPGTGFDSSLTQNNPFKHANRHDVFVDDMPPNTGEPGDDVEADAVLSKDDLTVDAMPPHTGELCDDAAEAGAVLVDDGPHSMDDLTVDAMPPHTGELCDLAR